jgi:ABC-type spermidine/putrescine transport system permease subunit I
MLVGKFIALKITGLRHWPLAAALSLALVALIMGLLLVYLRLGGSKEAFQEFPR